MPLADKGKVQFVYRLGSLVDDYGKPVASVPVAADVENICGGTQVVRFEGGWLAVVHESSLRPDNGQRYYRHRFVWFDVDMKPARLSLPFVFHDKQIEFAAGLAHHPDGKRMVISYGVRDEEARLATISHDDIKQFLWKQV
jgi:predicted GH43/DUF377 family glycosyl hydrolase